MTDETNEPYEYCGHVDSYTPGADYEDDQDYQLPEPRFTGEQLAAMTPFEKWQAGVPVETIRDLAYDCYSSEHLSEIFGADLMNQLAAHWRGPQETLRVFEEWFAAVMAPIGVPRESAFKMFTGAVTIDDFVDGLDEELLDTFLERYPALQQVYQARIDSGEVTT